MSIAAIVAVITTVLSVGVKVVGMPDQIRANRRRKSTDGLSWWFMLCTLVSYAMWVIHGLLAHDMSLVIGQGLGVVATAIIVGQMVMYRKTMTVPRKSKRPTILWYASMLQHQRAKLRAKEDEAEEE
jgi:uncharacterized protein with PQ loop repeat